MKRILLILGILTSGCIQHTESQDSLSLIQIQDRNGLTETISNPDRLTTYEGTNFLSNQPYKKVLRVFKNQGKNSSIITTYHPNGMIRQYLEAEEMRAKGAYREWYPTGQQKIEAYVIGGIADLADGAQNDWLFEGTSTVWDEAGNIIAKIPYSKGFLSGKSTYYYPNGMIRSEVNFDKNELSGTSTEYTSKGKICSKTQYIMGLKHGESLGFFEDGSTAWLEEFDKGRLKEGKYYDLNGDLLSEIEAGGGFQARYNKNQELLLTEYRIGLPDGLVKEITAFNEVRKTYFMKKGRKNGEETEYYLNGPNKELCPKLAIQWKDNAIHGTVKTWYENGQQESEREFSLNTQSGPALAWYLNGDLMLYEEYDEGRLKEGKYYKKQKKDPISKVVKGSGVATLYDENGALLRKVVYLNGKPLEPEN